MVVTHLTADAVDIKDVDWTKPTAIVLGNEKDGEALLAARLCVGAATHCHSLRFQRGLKHRRNYRSWRMPVGVSADVIAAADIFAILPMHGMVDSLNVSVAAALMLNEARRGRQQVTSAITSRTGLHIAALRCSTCCIISCLICQASA